ncbi:PREDICTED: uncharacterized protein LOC106813129 [Priapulus caudatus]|uniref:Uncharacterized protein LOC106813129 n=1 Tax=Priapulus caudatus TaxID=37621 RepID=A0ABM1EKF5_PRICU|nr:PREDICTED: uncharacterized protein LOC106813129 [Priapulus caudatus]
MFSGFGKQLGGMIGQKMFGTEEASNAGQVAGEIFGKVAGNYFSGKDGGGDGGLGDIGKMLSGGGDLTGIISSLIKGGTKLLPKRYGRPGIPRGEKGSHSKPIPVSTLGGTSETRGTKSYEVRVTVLSCLSC